MVAGKAIVALATIQITYAIRWVGRAKMALWMDGVVTSVKLGTLGGVLLGASYGLDRLQSWALP